MENIYETNKVIAQIEFNDENINENYFLDFLQTHSFDVGILVLKPGQKDIQKPHSQDELYYIIEGNGFIEIGNTTRSFHSGSCIFIPSNTHHRFFDNISRIVVLYVFSK
jgi:mannose-6-phosphate isomerase-like protein (cupin superfamily)